MLITWNLFTTAIVIMFTAVGVKKFDARKKHNIGSVIHPFLKAIK